MSATGMEKQTAAATPDELREQVVEALKTVFDPEIPVNIYELGLIYTVDVNEARDVKVEMTLTSELGTINATGTVLAGETFFNGTVQAKGNSLRAFAAGLGETEEEA